MSQKPKAAVLITLLIGAGFINVACRTRTSNEQTATRNVAASSWDSDGRRIDQVVFFTNVSDSTRGQDRATDPYLCLYGSMRYRTQQDATKIVTAGNSILAQLHASSARALPNWDFTPGSDPLADALFQKLGSHRPPVRLSFLARALENPVRLRATQTNLHEAEARFQTTKETAMRYKNALQRLQSDGSIAGFIRAGAQHLVNGDRIENLRNAAAMQEDLLLIQKENMDRLIAEASQLQEQACTVRNQVIAEASRTGVSIGSESNALAWPLNDALLDLYQAPVTIRNEAFDWLRTCPVRYLDLIAPSAGPSEACPGSTAAERDREKKERDQALLAGLLHSATAKSFDVRGKADRDIIQIVETYPLLRKHALEKCLEGLDLRACLGLPPQTPEAELRPKSNDDIMRRIELLRLVSHIETAQAIQEAASAKGLADLGNSSLTDRMTKTWRYLNRLANSSD